MGLIQSIFCTLILCFERVVSWTCCALVLVLIMTMILVLTVYGISLGYHYAQKELATFAMGSPDAKSKALRSGHETVNEPVVRLVAVNRSQGEQAKDSISGLYENKQITEPMFMESSATPIFVLESERPIKELELTPHERELARRLIGRFRRARKNNSTGITTLNPGENSTDAASDTSTTAPK